MGRAIFSCSDAGQATVEAAFLLPAVFVVLLLLAQPAIVLYDRMVMEGAAAQGLRMLSTRGADAADRGFESVIESQLAAIPQVDIFHRGGREWDISLSGNEGSGEVSVTIANKVAPLPLLGAPLYLAGLLDGDGNIAIEVSVEGSTLPGWALEQEGGPEQWVSQWE